MIIWYTGIRVHRKILIRVRDDLFTVVLLDYLILQIKIKIITNDAKQFQFQLKGYCARNPSSKIDLCIKLSTAHFVSLLLPTHYRVVFCVLCILFSVGSVYSGLWVALC